MKKSNYQKKSYTHHCRNQLASYCLVLMCLLVPWLLPSCAEPDAPIILKIDKTLPDVDVVWLSSPKYGAIDVKWTKTTLKANDFDAYLIRFYEASYPEEVAEIIITDIDSLRFPLERLNMGVKYVVSVHVRNSKDWVSKGTSEEIVTKEYNQESSSGTDVVLPDLIGLTIKTTGLVNLGWIPTSVDISILGLNDTTLPVLRGYMTSILYNIAGREAWDKKILRDGVGAIFTVKGVPMGDRGTTPVVISTKTIDELQLYSENNSQVIEVNELDRGIQSMIGQSVDFWPNYDATYLLTTYPENQLLAFTDVKDTNTGIVGGANHDMNIDKAKFDRGDLGYRLKFEEVDPSIPNLYYLNGEIGKDKFFPLNPSISPYIESHHFNKNAGHGGVADRMSFLKGYVMYMDVLERTRDFQVEIGFIKQNQLRVFSFEAAVDANQKMIGYYIKVWENKAAYLNNNSPYYLVRPYGYYSNYRQDKYVQYTGALTDLGPYSAILKKLYPSDGLSYLFLTDASLEIYNQTFDLNGFQGKFYQAFEKAIVRPVLGVKLKYTSVSAVTADVPVTSSPKVAKTFTTIVNNCSNAKLTHFIGDARKVSNSTITTRQTTRGEGTFNSYEHEVYGSLSYSKGFGIPGAGAGFTVRVTSGWNKKHSELTTTDSGFATDTFSIDDNGISKTRTMYISPWNSIVVKEVSAEYQNITLYGAKIERVEGNFPSGRKLTGVELLAQLKQDGRVGTVDRVGADYVEYTEPFSIHIDRLNETFINVEEKATCIVP